MDSNCSILENIFRASFDLSVHPNDGEDEVDGDASRFVVEADDLPLAACSKGP